LSNPGAHMFHGTSRCWRHWRCVKWAWRTEETYYYLCIWACAA